jgi:hypothetical protein
VASSGGGGAFYIETSGTSTLTMSGKSTATTQQTDGNGGFLFGKSSSTLSVIIDDSEVALSASNQKGGFGYFESTGTSSIEVRNKGLINTANSMNDMGGIAYMGGINNILTIGDAAQVTACGAK